MKYFRTLRSNVSDLHAIQIILTRVSCLLCIFFIQKLYIFDSSFSLFSPKFQYEKSKQSLNNVWVQKCKKKKKFKSVQIIKRFFFQERNTLLTSVTQKAQIQFSENSPLSFNYILAIYFLLKCKYFTNFAAVLKKSCLLSLDSIF